MSKSPVPSKRHDVAIVPASDSPGRISQRVYPIALGKPPVAPIAPAVSLHKIWRLAGDLVAGDLADRRRILFWRLQLPPTSRPVLENSELAAYFEVMKNRIEGLQRECDQLADELTATESGKVSQRGEGPNGEDVDLSTIWAEYLRAVLAAKRAILAELQKIYEQMKQ